MDPVVHTLLSASEQGHKQRIAALLAENPDRTEVCDDEGSTPLMYAAANGRENVLQLLLQNNVNVNSQNLYGWTALMQAACYGHLTCVFLLLQSGADVNMKNRWGCDALVAAAQGGFDTVVQLLLDGVKNQEGAKVNKEPKVSSLTPLMAAAQCGHTDIVTKLIKSGSNIDTTLKTTGWSALMLAAVNNQLEVAALLLQHGADRELKDVSKRTASQLAMTVGHKEMVQLLTGERVDRVSDSDFFDAVKAGQLDNVVDMLKENEALAMAKTKDGVTPLMRAANKGHMEICEVLLKAGCPVNAKDSVNGWTALMQATHQRRYAVAKLLGEHGADPNIRGKSGSTALVIANMLGDIEMIRVISKSSTDRVRKISVPVTSTLATPTPSVTTPTTANTRLDKAAHKKVSLPSGPPRLKALPPSRPLDASEVIRKLKMEQSEPSPTPSSAFPTSEESSRFPNTRLRTQNSRPSSIATSFNSTTETYNDVSPGVSASPTPSPGAVEGSVRSLGSATPETPRSASHLMPHSPFQLRGGGGGGGGASRFLSRSNPPPSDAASRGGRGAVAMQLRGGRGPNLSSNSPLSRHPLVSPEASSRLTAARPALGRGAGIGRRDELPSFLHKYGGGSVPRLSPSIGMGRPREMAPLSWKQPGGQRNMEVERMQLQNSPARKRSFTEPLRPRPQSKPALQSVLEKASLGEYYQLFSEQELDLGSFLTLTESDLIDLCITSQPDRQRLLALIRKLQSGGRASPSVEQNGSQPSPVPPTPVFLFQ